MERTVLVEKSFIGSNHQLEGVALERVDLDHKSVRDL